MSIIINPSYEADCSKNDKGDKTWNLHFNVIDSDNAVIDPDEAYTAVYDYAKANDTYDDVKAKSIKLDEEPDGAGRVYRATITYTVDGDLGGEDSQSNTVMGTLRFSTKGHTSHITSSKQTVSTTAGTIATSTPPNFSGLLNVQDGAAQGVDITTPCLHIDVTAQIPTSWLATNPNFLPTFYELTGKVNNNALWGFPAHTLLFRGLDGSTNGSGACNLTFSFDYQPNVTTSIAPFGQVSKNGWDYVWTYTELHTDTNSNTTQPKPVGLYVERVYDETSFSAFNFIRIA